MSGVLLNRLMFWTDWGRNTKIEKSTLDGTQRVAIVTSNLSFPTGISLDRRNKLVYWVDASTGVIESVDYNGNNRKLLFQLHGVRLYGVIFTSSYLFVTGANTKVVYKMNASNGTIVSNYNVSIGGFGGYLQLAAYDRLLQLSGLQFNSTSL